MCSNEPAFQNISGFWRRSGVYNHRPLHKKIAYISGYQLLTAYVFGFPSCVLRDYV